MALADIYLDLQIIICAYLHPSDILTLRKTCKTLQLVTRRRTIWIDALRRVCLDNTLFLPSFPILDMSDVELERAAIAPRRWLELSTSYTAREIGDPKARLSPTATRIIEDPFPTDYPTSLILVPGGRYMVGFSLGGLGVWDLGYKSNADCKLIGSVGREGGCFSGKVHATPDGMGLVIFSRRANRCSFYEIYPQSENPQLIKVACLDLPPWHNHRSYICHDKIICFDFQGEETIFRIWDYRLNASVSFKALVDVEIFKCNAKMVATQTAIVVFHEEEIFIWPIPPLLPGPPDFYDCSLTQLPPAIRVKFPDGLALYPPLAAWRTMSSWYFDPLKPLYFDKVYSRHSQLQRFKIIIKPDFSNATLHFINTTQLTTPVFEREIPLDSMFCEDTLVYTWGSSDQCGIYTGSTLSRSILHGDPSVTKLSLRHGVEKAGPRDFSICPASGRIVLVYTGRKIVVLDFLPYHQRT